MYMRMPSIGRLQNIERSSFKQKIGAP